LERFESLLAKLTHSDFAIAFSSGTAAVHAALACLKLEPEDEVIMPTLTFCSVANMTRLVGARIVLVDCDPNTLTLSPEAARAAITDNTKAIFTNNFGGHPSDLQVFRDICNEHNLDLLEDASHGLGGKYRGHYVGNQADLTCFSFHPSKAITTCEGGAVTTNNRTIADWLRQFRHHGIQKDPRFFRTDEDWPAYYQELQFHGMNYRLSELHAALGRSQLTRLDRHIERRRSIAQMYFQKLSNIEELVLPHKAEWADSAFHLFTVQFTDALEEHRDDIFNDLKEAGIDPQVHYIPLHRMPLFAREWNDPDRFPNAEQYFKRSLSLPLYPDLSFKELERITECLMKSIEKHLPKVGGGTRDDSSGDEAENADGATDTDEVNAEDGGGEDDSENKPSRQRGRGGARQSRGTRGRSRTSRSSKSDSKSDKADSPDEGEQAKAEDEEPKKTRRSSRSRTKSSDKDDDIEKKSRGRSSRKDDGDDSSRNKTPRGRGRSSRAKKQTDSEKESGKDA
jgi:dTDP-4-amino-4,6-dideoxygalactose transaminase